MSIQHVNAISNRLSRCPPQRDSLEIPARVCAIISLEKDGDTAPALETIGILPTPRGPGFWTPDQIVVSIAGCSGARSA